jgi:GTP-binding protein
MGKIVAIIGRPNVGKSTFFNRMVEERQAIVHDESGVTRDRNYGIAEWNGVRFSLIDTGGYVPGSEELFEAAIREQVHIAMEEADVIVFLVDGRMGIHPMDREIAKLLHRQKKKVLLAVNKVDDATVQDSVFEFYNLALGEPMPVSAVSGSGTGDLLDHLLTLLPEDPLEETPNLPRFAIVGRPNVGKSSFVNALLDKKVNIVTPIAGTTRDAIDTRFQAFGHDLILVDTAGLRKRAKVDENIEFYSTLRTIRAIEECNVAILLMDATEGVMAQDLSVFSLIQENRKGLVIAVNKWDLVEKDTKTAIEFEKRIKERIAPFTDVPIIFTSTVEKQRLLKTLELALQVYENRERKIQTSQLNEIMLDAVARHHPPAMRGKIVKIKYVTQIPASSPTFLFFTNYPKDVAESYKRYLENQLRENFDFKGIPINIFFRKK